MKNSASNPSVLLKSERRRIRKLYESTTAANSGSYSQPMAWSEEIPSPCADETYGEDNIVDGSEELSLDVDELMNMLNLSEKEDKERMRKLHKENSIIKEEDSLGPSDQVMGISSELLHPNTIELLKSPQKKITTQMLLKIIAGCTENTPLEKFYVGSTASSRSDNRGGKNKLIVGKERGQLFLSSPSGQHIHSWDNLCNLSNNSDSTWSNLEGWPTYEEQRTSIINNYYTNWVDSLQNSMYDEELDVKTDNRYYKGGQQLTWKSVGNDQWVLSKK